MKRNKNGQKAGSKDDFRLELDKYVENGVSLWLNGRPSTPEKICRAHRVAENISYMRDYVRDDSGKLTRLGFDSVREDIT